jgi:hypothetical protein
MNDTPETEAAVIASGGDWSPVLRETCRRLERERDEALELHRNALRERETTEKEVDAMLERAHKAERERDEARDQLIHLRSCVYDVIHSLKAGAFDELEKAWKEGLK